MQATQQLSSCMSVDQSVLDIDEVSEFVQAGGTLTKYAKIKHRDPGRVYAWIFGNAQNLARYRAAQANAADACVDRADEVLDEIRLVSDVPRAREIAQHNRWKASKMAPARYGDKLDVNVTSRVDFGAAAARIAARSGHVIEGESRAIMPVCDLDAIGNDDSSTYSDAMSIDNVSITLPPELE